jgi:hypothetical protein
MTPAGRMFSDLARSEASRMNLKATPKSKVLYVVNTTRGQALYLGTDLRPRRPSRWERLKHLAAGSQGAAA